MHGLLVEHFRVPEDEVGGLEVQALEGSLP
jgi:hypothetical protein